VASGVEPCIVPRYVVTLRECINIQTMNHIAIVLMMPSIPRSRNDQVVLISLKDDCTCVALAATTRVVKAVAGFALD
jgi:hypothetical protein